MYPWAVNGAKLLRATKNSVTKTEDDIKERYISYGGLVREVAEVKKIKKNVE